MRTPADHCLVHSITGWPSGLRAVAVRRSTDSRPRMNTESWTSAQGALDRSLRAPRNLIVVWYNLSVRTDLVHVQHSS